MARTTTVTLPNGRVAKRTSAKAIYTHAVVIERPAEARAQAADRDAAYADAQAVRYLEALGGTFTVEEWTPGYLRAEVGGVFAGGWRSDRPGVDEQAARDVIRGYLTNSEERAEADRARAADIRAEGVTEYDVPRWSSRRDLAERAVAGEFAWTAERGFRAYVVEVEEA